MILALTNARGFFFKCKRSLSSWQRHSRSSWHVHGNCHVNLRASATPQGKSPPHATSMTVLRAPHQTTASASLAKFSNRSKPCCQPVKTKLSCNRSKPCCQPNKTKLSWWGWHEGLQCCSIWCQPWCLFTWCLFKEHHRRPAYSPQEEFLGLGSCRQAPLF